MWVDVRSILFLKPGCTKLMWFAATSYLNLTSYKVMSQPQPDIQDTLRPTTLKVAVPQRTALPVKPWRTSLYLLPEPRIYSRNLGIRRSQIREMHDVVTLGVTLHGPMQISRNRNPRTPRSADWHVDISSADLPVVDIYLAFV